MKSAKILGLIGVATAALMGLTGPALASTLTSSTGSTPTITAESSNTVLTGPFTEMTCRKSLLHRVVTSHGPGVTAAGPISTGGLTFSECSQHVTVINEGTLEVHGTSTTGNGTGTSKGAVVEITTSVGVCRIETGVMGTHIGTLTGSNNTGGHAVLHVNSALPYNGTSFFCGGSGTWEGTYTVTHPKTLEVH